MLLLVMARPSDTETDSLGVSADSDGQTYTSRWSPKADGDKDLQEYGKSLGVNPSLESDLAWVVREAFEAPLPITWTEHVDVEGRVYFFNQITEESTWSHPMDDVYRDLVAFIQKIRVEEPVHVIEQRAERVREHLLEVHQRALTHLDGWSGPYAAGTGGQYYYNERLGLSTWVSPIDSWEYELAVRHSVLHRSLLVGFSGSQETSQPSSGSDLLMTPMLQLPLGLARTEDEAQSSSRSFYTARESSRSGASARSVSDIASPARAKRPS